MNNKLYEVGLEKLLAFRRSTGNEQAVSEGPFMVHPLRVAGVACAARQLNDLGRVVLMRTLGPNGLEALERHLASGATNVHAMRRL